MTGSSTMTRCIPSLLLLRHALHTRTSRLSPPMWGHSLARGWRPALLHCAPHNLDTRGPRGLHPASSSRPRRRTSTPPSGAKSQIARLRFEGHHDGHDVLIGQGHPIQIMAGRPGLLRLGAVLAWGSAIGRIDFAQHPLGAYFQDPANPIGLAI